MIEGLALLGWGFMLGYLLSNSGGTVSNEHRVGENILKKARQAAFNRKVLGEGFKSTSSCIIIENGVPLAKIFISSKTDEREGAEA